MLNAFLVFVFAEVFIPHAVCYLYFRPLITVLKETWYVFSVSPFLQCFIYVLVHVKDLDSLKGQNGLTCKYWFRTDALLLLLLVVLAQACAS